MGLLSSAPFTVPSIVLLALLPLNPTFLAGGSGSGGIGSGSNSSKRAEGDSSVSALAPALTPACGQREALDLYDLALALKDQQCKVSDIIVT